MKESVRSINKESILLERKLLGDFSTDFWSLCIRSSVFTLEEKKLIKSDFINEKVNLLNEEWDFLNKAIDWVSDKSSELKTKMFDKIKKIKNLKKLKSRDVI